MILGSGQEGVVWLEGGEVCKRFRLGVLSDAQVVWFQQTLRNVMPHLPEPTWQQEGQSWCMRYRWFETDPVETFTLEEAREFLLFCLGKSIVCGNIKRTNFRRRPEGGLTFIDIGTWVVPMNVDYFRDASARAFAIADLGWSDEELHQRSGELRTDATLQTLPGFAEFYKALLSEHGRRQWEFAAVPQLPPLPQRDSRATLLIKACAMDAGFLSTQARHIVDQLESRRSFAEQLLIIDPYRGPFLRQHQPGDFDLLLSEAKALKDAGVIDRFLVAPEEQDAVSAINQRWFGLPCPHSHSVTGVPVSSQLWGFEQVGTRYVLQCDTDVLIGRRDLSHDYLEDMLKALHEEDVLSVAFNIPHHAAEQFRPYSAPPGEFVPEVRCGLFDLERIRSCLPLPNTLAGGKLALTWYRSMQRHQQSANLRTLRGGDPRTFYVHPQNSWKVNQENLNRVRDLIGQGCVPAAQLGSWDLVGPPAIWAYPRRKEAIVFVLKGRNTPAERARRCLLSLAMQHDQDFGIIVIDDGSDAGVAPKLPHLLTPFGGRATLVRHSRRCGRMPNFLLAIRELCVNPETLVVILDLDDALLQRSAIQRLREAYKGGADVILAAMFRPDKPLKLYHPDFSEPRAHWGGEVWIHLRAFRKRLFDALPVEALQIDGHWIEHCTDFATMIPIVECCQRPVYLPEYLYFHERSTPSTPQLRTVKEQIIRVILSKPKLKAC